MDAAVALVSRLEFVELRLRAYGVCVEKRMDKHTDRRNALKNQREIETRYARRAARIRRERKWSSRNRDYVAPDVALKALLDAFFYGDVDPITGRPTKPGKEVA